MTPDQEAEFDLIGRQREFGVQVLSRGEALALGNAGLGSGLL